MKQQFETCAGIACVRNPDIQAQTHRVVRDKLYTTPYAEDIVPDLLDKVKVQPMMMEELLADEDTLRALEDRLVTLGINPLISFYHCGEDSLVFNFETDNTSNTNYVFRIAPAYNRAFDLNMDDMPSPMLTPIYHEVLKVGKEGIRIMVLPRLQELNVPDRTPWMQANNQAMKELGYVTKDTGRQNFMNIRQDQTLTPFCMDFGVYGLDEGTKPIPESDEGITVDGFRINIPEREFVTPFQFEAPSFHWKGKLPAAFPILNLTSPEERLATVLAEVREMGPVNTADIRHTQDAIEDNSSIVFE